MSETKRFSGLMGKPDTAASVEAPVASPATVADTVPALVTAPNPVATPAAGTTEKKSKAKVQLNTQQPEELKNAVDKAAAYLSFTTGKKVTTTDVVERALRVYLETLPEAARGN